MGKIRIKWGLVVFVLLIGAGLAHPAQSQDGGSCDVLVSDAMRIMGTACATTGRDEACYGHSLVAATFLDEAENMRFTDAGDIVALPALQALFTQPADPDTGEWGVALMKVGADLPDTDTLTLVLLGDAEVTSTVDPALSACTLTNSGAQNLNVRGGPGTDRAIVDVLPSGESAAATGRNEAGDWLRIARNAVAGWVYAPLVTANCELTTLPVVEESAPAYIRPMQAFTLSSGSTSGCEQAPDGLLIRSTSGQRAHVMVNGVALEFASAAFLTAQPDGVLMVEGVEGAVTVTAANVSVTVKPGQQTSVPLAGLDAAGPPSTPAPVEAHTPVSALLIALDEINQLPAVLSTGGAETAESTAGEPPSTDGPFVPGTYIETLTVTDLFLPEGCMLSSDFPSAPAGVNDEIGNKGVLEVYLSPGPDNNTFERTVYSEWGIFSTGIFQGFGGTYWMLDDMGCRTDRYEIRFTSTTTYDFTMRTDLQAAVQPECEGGYRVIEGTGAWQPEGEGEVLADSSSSYDVNACQFIGKPARAGQNVVFSFATYSCNDEAADEMEQYTISIDVDGEPLAVTQYRTANEYDFRWGITGFAEWTATSGTHTVTAVSDYPCEGSPGADLTTCTFTIP